MFRDMGLSESYLHTTSFLIGFLVFSALPIVIGEQVLKTLAIRKAEPVSIAVAYPLHFCYLLVWPLNWLLNRTLQYYSENAQGCQSQPRRSV
ncbi:MAG: CBS domain containing-hemolysin-like protein [Planctomycetota bacterium]|jgi:CBS domain containing-hemolysin-like protein